MSHLDGCRTLNTGSHGDCDCGLLQADIRVMQGISDNLKQADRTERMSQELLDRLREPVKVKAAPATEMNVAPATQVLLDLLMRAQQFAASVVIFEGKDMGLLHMLKMEAERVRDTLHEFRLGAAAAMTAAPDVFATWTGTLLPPVDLDLGKHSCPVCDDPLWATLPNDGQAGGTLYTHEVRLPCWVGPGARERQKGEMPDA